MEHFSNALNHEESTSPSSVQSENQNQNVDCSIKSTIEGFVTVFHLNYIVNVLSLIQIFFSHNLHIQSWIRDHDSWCHAHVPWSQACISLVKRATIPVALLTTPLTFSDQ